MVSLTDFIKTGYSLSKKKRHASNFSAGGVFFRQLSEGGKKW